MGIGFDGTLDAYLAITDSMPNPTQHVSADLVYPIDSGHECQVEQKQSLLSSCIAAYIVAGYLDFGIIVSLARSSKKHFNHSNLLQLHNRMIKIPNVSH